MKKIIMLIALLVFAGSANAASVSLTWDPPDEGLQDKYRIFVAAAGAEFDYSAPAWEGVENFCRIDGLEAGKLYRFVARAVYGAVESGNSNILEAPIAPAPVIIKYPGPVKGFRIEVIGE